MTSPTSPQDIDAEQQVLGAMLVSEPAVTQAVSSGLDAQDYYLDGHRVIHEAISHLAKANQPCDPITVSARLTDTGKIEEAGGKSSVFALAEKVSAPGNVAHHAATIRERSRQRRVADLGYELTKAAQSGPIDGKISELTKALLKVEAHTTSGQIETVKGSDITLRRVEFADAANMLPTGSVTVTVGLAGLGKTAYLVQVAAAFTNGRMTGIDEPRNVLLSSQEDDPEAVLAPRLVAAGADLARVHFVKGLSLPSQVPALAARAKAIEACLVGIDPIAAHLDSNIDSHKDAGIRTALSPLAEMSSDLRLVTLIVAHPNKAQGVTGLNRISGSGGLGNAARSVIVFGSDPTDPDGETGSRRVIAHLKCNVGKRAPSLSAEITTCLVDTEDGPSEVPKLNITGTSDLSADDVFQSPSSEERSEREEATEFLSDLLSKGPVRSKEIKDVHARSAGLHWRTVERAKTDLKVKAKQQADGWYWELEGHTDD